MKTLFKVIKWLLVLVVVLGVVLYFTRNMVARRAVEVAAKEMTGFPLEIGSVDIGLFGGTLEVRDLKMMNPPEFHGGTFIILPLVKVDYVTMSFLSKSPHIKELVVDVAEVHLVKNEKGETNATVLQDRASSVGSGGETKPADTTGGKPDGGTPKEEKKKMPYRVDLVKVHVGTVVKRTFSSDGKSSENKITLNANATYKDVTESTSITKLVMDTVFGQVGAVAGEMIKGAGEAIKGAGDSIQKATKGLFDSLKKKQ
jgi:uncharacterized protein involved in outer membrane biogenesis